MPQTSTRQQEGVYSAAMGAITQQLKSPGTIAPGVKDKGTAAGLLEALPSVGDYALTAEITLRVFLP